MNQRGGSCGRLEGSAKSAFRKVIGTLALVGLLTLTRFAHAQGSIIISPLPGDVTNLYPQLGTSNSIWWILESNTNFTYAGWDTNFVFTPLDSSVFSNFFGGSIFTNGTLRIISWTGSSNFIGGNQIVLPPWIPNGSILLPPFPPTPTNDNFANAFELFGTAFTVVSPGILGATAEPGEPVHGTNSLVGHSTWWRWTPTIGGPTAIRYHSYGAVVAVYTGESVGALERVPLTTTNLLLGASIIGIETVSVFEAEAGVTYHFAADGSATAFAWTLDQQLLEITAPIPARVNVGTPVTLGATPLPGNDPSSVEFLLVERVPTLPYIIVGTPGISISSSGFVWSQSLILSQLELQYVDVPRIILPPVTDYYVPAAVSLGTAYTPPYQISWIPTNLPGPYYLWARSTNALGEVHETMKAQIDIYAANDDFALATEIDPLTTSTNFPYSSLWSTAETNEPPHRFGPAFHSLWWKWTPSSSGSVRLKAVRNQIGVPLEVFTGNDFSNLRRIGDNLSTMSRSGFSGLVRLRVKAGQTYYIRVDEDWRGPRPRGLSGPGVTAPDSTLTVEPANTPLPGELNFSLIAASFYTRNGPRVIPYGRVFQPDKHTPVTGSQYRAQLYVGATPTDLAPVGMPMPFFGSIGYGGPVPGYEGLFPPEIVQLPNTVGGQRVYAQIRVWDATVGYTFDDARANGGPVGFSMIIKVIAGSEETGPAPLMGMRSFSLRNPNH